MRKHTPGPWKKLDGGRNIETPSGTFYLTYGREKDSGAPLFRDFAELDANCILIAAAPDLLAACERVLRAIRWSETDDRMTDDDLAALLSSAIAKAQGE